ncbi:MAG TPA: hypothetical protein VFL76_07900 [Edaphocola sp.]|nr:hypothetical protein [Edaphocola sp.]
MRTYITFVFLCGFLLAAGLKPLHAQKEAASFFDEYQDSLNILAGNMFHAMLPDDRMNAGISFAKLLYKTLKAQGSFQYHFDSLGRQIHILYPEDRSFRIFNWLVPAGENIVRYYGIVQTTDTVYPLVNYSERLIDSKTFLFDSLDAKHWFGAEYYRILTRKVNGTDYYFIFGLNMDGIYSNKKIIDVLHFGESGPVFGAPLFVYPSEDGRLQRQDRILWQYKKGAAFSLDFDNNRKFIAFDELHSRINDPLRKDTYVPTGKVDGLRWENDHWLFVDGAITPMRLKDGQAPINGVIQN